MSDGDPQCIIRLMLGLSSPIPKATVATTTHKGDSFCVKFRMMMSLTILSVHAVNMSTKRSRAMFGDPTGSTASFPREIVKNTQHLHNFGKKQ